MAFCFLFYNKLLYIANYFILLILRNTYLFFSLIMNIPDALALSSPYCIWFFSNIGSPAAHTMAAKVACLKIILAIETSKTPKDKDITSQSIIF